MSATSYADALFVSAHHAGRLHQIWAKLQGHSRRLFDLNAVAATGAVGARRTAGMQTVAISRIGGSEGRCDDFDSAFRPLKAHTEERWRRVATAYLHGIGLPAVELIQVGEIYYVRDGHHRISVAAALEQQEIDAVVTVWQLAEPAPQERSVDKRSQRRRSWVSLPRLAWRSAGAA